MIDMLFVSLRHLTYKELWITLKILVRIFWPQELSLATTEVKFQKKFYKMIVKETVQHRLEYTITEEQQHSFKATTQRIQLKLKRSKKSELL